MDLGTILIKLEGFVHTCSVIILALILQLQPTTATRNSPERMFGIHTGKPRFLNKDYFRIWISMKGYILKITTLNGLIFFKKISGKKAKMTRYNNHNSVYDLILSRRDPASAGTANDQLRTFMLVLHYNIYAQKVLSRVDSDYIKKTDYARRIFLGNESVNRQYLIFCIGNKIVLINKIRNSYRLYKGEINFTNQKRQLDNKKSSFLAKNNILERCSKKMYVLSQ